MKKTIALAMVATALMTGTANAGLFDWCLPKVVGKPTPTPGGHTVIPGVGVIVHGVALGMILTKEVSGPPCSSDTPYNIAHGYDTKNATFWRPICGWTNNTVELRG